MPTHKVPCVVCGELAWCTSDAHALGCGDGGCYQPGKKIEFCSEDCFRRLYARMSERWRIYCEIMEHNGRAKPSPLGT